MYKKFLRTLSLIGCLATCSEVYTANLEDPQEATLRAKITVYTAKLHKFIDVGKGDRFWKCTVCDQCYGACANNKKWNGMISECKTELSVLEELKKLKVKK